MYGGTSGRKNSSKIRHGLSPRVRGNLEQETEEYETRRSIPACTGEPGQGSQPPGQGQVYPRVYGGTWRRNSSQRNVTGLSPRVRGNP